MDRRAFEENDKSIVNIYFKSNKASNRITLDWESTYFLSVEKYHTS
ncbi:hypothetical protein HBE96_05830 [Clostridium sp. P21]|uniref:Uncharacterized protein n=1 Tax=Clostridium muellerianum TaxID=2716538 RepID=A0A7Y0EF41_9CLOT|nr:hypothetical protein [Clostridium muellerianum]NMM62211.1 hypothetical protein [Clostridium muellerianum]